MKRTTFSATIDQATAALVLTANASSSEQNKIYIGIDNGVSGSIGWVDLLGIESGFKITPIFKTLNYQKKVKNVNRIDFKRLNKFIRVLCHSTTTLTTCLALIERPMVNPGRFQASASALRAMETTLNALEWRGVPYRFVDSKEWQKIMLPKGIKGTPALKEASLQIGQRLFPQFTGLYKGDADGILIAEWARRERL